MKVIPLGVWLAILSSVTTGAGAVPDTEAARTTDQVRDRTEAALQQRLAGDNEGAVAALNQIVSEFPDAPLAHWALGDVWANKKWLPFNRVVHEEGRWPELYKYQQERERRQDTFRDQLFLADGCRAHGLTDEERAHLTRTLMWDYRFEEGHRRLGHVNVAGVWITPQQLRRAAQQVERDQQHLAAWQEQVQRLHRIFKKAQPGTPREKQVLEQLNAIRTPDAIPALERFFASHGEREMDAYQNWLAGIDSHEAARVLARQSVFLDDARLRTRAQQLLRNRRYEEYVPGLLSALETVTEHYGLEIDVSSLIAFRVRREVEVNGQDFQFASSGTRTIIPSDSEVRTVGPGGIAVVAVGTQAESARELADVLSAWYQQLIAQSFGLQAASARQDVRTSRASRALEVATQVEGNKTAEDWWAWWRNQNDLVLLGDAKINDRYDEIWYVDRRGPVPVSGVGVIPLRFNPSSGSCFAPGTLVETEHGLRKIDDVKIGDRVLAQDVETGELQFKPVFATTKRDHADLLSLKTSAEEITCSIGHPFWVAGKGWRMARELEPGMQLYSLDGRLIDVQEIKEAGTGTVLNLIVADFSTYFAGSSRIFTHDVTPRTATDMVLPGLRKEFRDILTN